MKILGGQNGLRKRRGGAYDEQKKLNSPKEIWQWRELSGGWKAMNASVCGCTV